MPRSARARATGAMFLCAALGPTIRANGASPTSMASPAPDASECSTPLGTTTKRSSTHAEDVAELRRLNSETVRMRSARRDTVRYMSRYQVPKVRL